MTYDLFCYFNSFIIFHRYMKSSDPEGWVDVDENSGVITILKRLDREARSGVYNISVIASDKGKDFVFKPAM